MDSHQTPIRITHIITSLGVGGAETMLYKLLAYTDRSRFAPEVICLVEPGPMGRKIEALGIRVRSLGMSRGTPNPLQVLRLIRWLKEQSPDLVQTWMYHANLVGGIAALLAGRVPLCWNIRSGALSEQTNRRRTIHIARLCATLSHRLPARVIFCSEAACSWHVNLGYAPERVVVIRNGFAVDMFQPDSAARTRLRRELEVPEQTLIIGMAARYHPVKDHANLIQAAAEIHEDFPQVHWVLFGDDIVWENRELASLIEERGFRHRFHLLGRRNDVPNVMAGLDLATLSSADEGFPNVIGEAMACGVPCVVTDVGDSAAIVGDTGIVVPPRNPHALAEGWRKMLELPAEQRAHLGTLARQRVIEHYSLTHIVSEYESLYEAVLASKGRQYP